MFIIFWGGKLNKNQQNSTIKTPWIWSNLKQAQIKRYKESWLSYFFFIKSILKFYLMFTKYEFMLSVIKTKFLKIFCEYIHRFVRKLCLSSRLDKVKFIFLKQVVVTRGAFNIQQYFSSKIFHRINVLIFLLLVEWR